MSQITETKIESEVNGHFVDQVSGNGPLFVRSWVPGPIPAGPIPTGPIQDDSQMMTRVVDKSPLFDDENLIEEVSNSEKNILMSQCSNEFLSESTALQITLIDSMTKCLRCVKGVDWVRLKNTTQFPKKNDFQCFLKHNRAFFDRKIYMKYYLELVFRKYKSAKDMYENVVYPEEYTNGSFPQLTSVIAGFYNGFIEIEKANSTIFTTISGFIKNVNKQDEDSEEDDNEEHESE